MDYAERLARHGGIANCGDSLGVFVAPRNTVKQTPSGWVFVPLETATTEIVREALDCAKAGRSGWPDKARWA